MPDDDLNQQKTIIINDIEASSREEMVCPECGEHSIEEHYSASEYPTEKAAILKASHCTNPDCDKKMLSPNEVDKQYSPKGLKEQLFTTKSLLQLAVALIGVIVLISFFFGNPLAPLFEEPKVSVTGSITTVDGEPLPNATVSLENTEFEATTDESGQYEFDEVPVGEYFLSVDPPESSESKSFGSNITVESGEIQITDEFVSNQLYSTEGTTLNAQLPRNVAVSESFTAQNTEQTITYISEKNRDNATIELRPLEQSELQTTSTSTISIGESTNISVQGNIIDSTLTGSGTVTTEQFSTEKTTDDSGRVSLNVHGTETPLSGEITLGEGAGTTSRTETLNIQSGNSQSVDVNGTVTGAVDMTVRGGATDTPQTISETWSPGDGPIQLDISSDDAPSTTTLTFNGEVTTEDKSITGTLNQKTEEITVNIDGSINPSESVIKFTGGDLQSEQIASGSTSATGENGAEERTTELTTVQNDGSYELDYNFQQTNSEYVSAGYTINGEKTEVDSGTNSVTVDLTSGDTVGLWITAEQEQLEQVNHSYDGPIEVTNVEVSDRELDEPGSIGLRATVENTGSTADYTSVTAYKDGESWDTGTADLSPGETKQITFNRVEFESDGIYAIQVNNSRVIEITVGDGSLEYGEGSISSDVNYLADSGRVEVDSTGDGSTNCEATVPNDSCSISLENGENTLTLTQHNVTNTQYALDYTARFGAKDIKADLDNDGTYELIHEGVLSDGNSISESITFSAGTHDIPVVVGNNESITYDLKWTQSGVIDSPKVSINGTEVVTVDETYQGEKEFSIEGEHFNDGSNTVTLETNDNEEHTIVLDWTERGADSYPQIVLEDDNTVLCSSADFTGDNSCNIDTSELSPGQTTVVLEKEGQTVPDTTVTFKHKARAVPVTLDLINTETDSSILFTKTNAQTRNNDGSWKHTKDKIIDQGEYTVETNTSSNVGLSGSVTIKATAERSQAINPTISINHSDGTTTEIPVPQNKLNESGKLTEPITIEIPKDKFKRGTNTIVFSSENNGVYNVELVGTHDG